MAKDWYSTICENVSVRLPVIRTCIQTAKSVADNRMNQRSCDDFVLLVLLMFLLLSLLLTLPNFCCLHPKKMIIKIFPKQPNKMITDARVKKVYQLNPLYESVSKFGNNKFVETPVTSITVEVEFCVVVYNTIKF